MFDAVVDPQPVTSRLTRSTHLLSPFLDTSSLSSKNSIPGYTKTLGFLSPHRRTNSDAESTAPSFQDYLLLSGGGLEPGLKVSPDARSIWTRRSSSSCEASDSTYKGSTLLSPSTGYFSIETCDQDLKNDSCAADLTLNDSLTPTTESRNESNSISSFLSVLVSALTTTRRIGEPKQLGNMSMRSPTSIQFPEMPAEVGGQVNEGPDSSVNTQEVSFASPSFIRPQGRKLVARREPSPMVHNPSTADLEDNNSTISSTMNESSLLVRSSPTVNMQYNQSANSFTMDVRDEVSTLSRVSVKQDVISEQDETSEYDAGRHNQMPLSKYIPGHYHISEDDHVPRLKNDEKRVQAEKKPVRASFDQRIDDQIDSIVKIAALDDSTKSEWRTYMENYSKGSFNVSTPPASPTVSSTLQYLPSIFPSTEAQRVSVFNSHCLSWNKVTSDKLSHLLAAVMDKFELDCGAISFFSKENECIKAERGYNVESIPRSVSIAAHGLLSADVFVVLDTAKDWRFQNHPLVVEGPNIRFFAGAPLLGEGGQPIGMLSIFSETCQPDFSPFDRRELANYAAEAMKGLTLESRFDRSSRGPPTPKLEGDPVAGETRLRIGSDPTDLDNNDGHDLAPAPSSLHYHTSKTQSDRVVNKPTNHNSSSPQDHGSLPEPNQSYNQPGDSNLDDDPSLYKLDDLHITDFVPPSPRPFSSSDVSSIDKHPTNTPVHSQSGLPTAPSLDFSVELMRSLSRAEYADSTREESQYMMSNSKFTELSPLKTTPRTLEPNTLLSPHASISGGAHMWPGENSALISYRPASRDDARAKAALICSRTANRLGYDMIYAVELNPSLDAIDETKVLEPGVLPMRILAAYGMNEPFRPNPQIHIEALRSKGFYSWETPRNTDEAPGGYRSGYLIGIPTQGGVRHLRTSGIVIGAFRKSHPSTGNAIEMTNAELRRLIDAGNEVKSLFWLTPDSSRRPSLPQFKSVPIPEPDTSRRPSLPQFKSPHIPEADGSRRPSLPQFKSAYILEADGSRRPSLPQFKPVPIPETGSSRRPSLPQFRSSPISEPYPANEAVEIGQYTTDSPLHSPTYVNSPRINSGNAYTPGSYTQDPSSNEPKPTTKKPIRFQFMPSIARRRQQNHNN